jgi:predicted porin
MHADFKIHWSWSVIFVERADQRPNSGSETLASQHFGDYSMKKTQVALAALALVASTAALADGVKAYGTIDASIVSTSAGTGFGGAGNSAGTIFGFTGSEDVGGGLKAGFALESGIQAATGATGANGGVGSAVFNRAANVSLSNESVGITLGTQISPFIGATLTGVTGVGGNGAFVPAMFKAFGGTLANVGAGSSTSATLNGGFFVPGAVNISASGSGLTANVMYRVGDNTQNSSYQAASLTGGGAGINLALAYQSVGAASAAGAGNTATTAITNTAIAANTEVAGVRLNALYSNNKSTTTNSGYILGASMPLVGALAGGLTYSNNSGLAQGTATTFSLQYTMSKATFGYLNYSQFSKSHGASASEGAAANDNAGLGGKSLLAVGLAHSF